jgi:hypothetical protein
MRMRLEFLSRVREGVKVGVKGVRAEISRKDALLDSCCVSLSTWNGRHKLFQFYDRWAYDYKGSIVISSLLDPNSSSINW